MTFILLAIFSISQVTAAENVTDDNLSCEIHDEELNLTHDDIIDDNSYVELNDSEIADKIIVEFDEKMWEENLTDFRVEFPDGAGGEFCLKLDNEAIFNQTITNKSIIIPTKLPKPQVAFVEVCPPYDFSYIYHVSAFYNNVELNISHSLKIMKNSPDYMIPGEFPCEILQYEEMDFRYSLLIPRSANGDVELYIDGRKINATNNAPFIQFDNSEITSLAVGNHTLFFKYLGDNYYHPFNATFDFNVTNVIIDIPKTVNISNDDCITVRVLKNTSGKVDVYIDGVWVSEGNVYEGKYWLALEDYLKWNSSQVKVVFTGNEYNATKTASINVTYDFDIWVYSSIVGDEFLLEVAMPKTLNKELLYIDLNGIEYNSTSLIHILDHIVAIDISKLKLGDYKLFVSYPGDNRFVPKNKTFDFNVTYDLLIPYLIDYLKPSEVSLKLPSDAGGKLCVYVDGVLFKSVKMNNGDALIKLDGLSPGHYRINATYDGGDYLVDDLVFDWNVSAKITLDDYTVVRGVDSYIRLQVPASTKGYVIFRIEKNIYNVTVKDGIAKLNLKDFGTGVHDIDIEYHGANGYVESYIKHFEVKNPKLVITSVRAYTTGIAAQIKVLNHLKKPVANLKVGIIFNGKSYIIKTNSKGIATFKKSLALEAKKYRFTAQYGPVKKQSIVKARHVLSLKTVKIKKSARKLVIKATLKEGKNPIKGKIVTFKFNGKKIRAKSNKNGVAKAIIKNAVLKKLKVAKKITYQATYLKDSVKKTVKVAK